MERQRGLKELKRKMKSTENKNMLINMYKKGR